MKTQNRSKSAKHPKTVTNAKSKTARSKTARSKTDSPSSQEIAAQGVALKKAQTQITKLLRNLAKTSEKRVALKIQLKALGGEKSKKAEKMKLNVRKLADSEKSLRSEVRESKSRMRDQKALTAALTRKELDRQKALKTFLDDWESQYDREKNIVEMRISVQAGVSKTV